MIGGLTALIVTSPGWTTVRETFFSWTWFQRSFSDVLSAFWLDVRMFVIVEAIVLVLALGIAVCRISRSPAMFPLKLLSIVFIDVFRGTPTILVVYLIGFGVPALNLTGVPTDPVVLGCAALSLSYSAYVAEVYRAGIYAVAPSQRAGAIALGLTEAQTMRFVVLPQAVRKVLPPLLNDFISLQKDVALVSIIGLQEAFRVAQVIQGESFNFTPLVAAAVLYIAVTIPLARTLDVIQARERRRREAAWV